MGPHISRCKIDSLWSCVASVVLKLDPRVRRLMSSAYPVSSCYSGGFDHPVQRIQARAEELSGVSYEEAHFIDNVNLGEKIGEFEMMGLSEAFYKKCVEDPDEWFSHMFLGKSDFIGDQNEYLMQRLGGPSYYSDRKGHPNLIASHAHLEMTSRTAERWLDHMEETLEELENKESVINHKQKTILMNQFRYQAYMLVASQEAATDMSEGGPVPPNCDETTSKCPFPLYSKLDGPLPSELEDEKNARIASAAPSVQTHVSIDFGLDAEDSD